VEMFNTKMNKINITLLILLTFSVFNIGMGKKPDGKNNIISNAKENLSFGNGYKEFRWGETIAQVKKKVKDLGAGYGDLAPQVNYAMQFLIPDSDSASWNDYENKYKKEGRSSQTLKLNFYFYDNKLRGISFPSDEKIRAFELLCNKYGVVLPKIFKEKSSISEVAVWYKKTNNLIIFSQKQTQWFVYENIFYIDGLWYNDIENSIVKNRKTVKDDFQNKLQ